MRNFILYLLQVPDRQMEKVGQTDRQTDSVGQKQADGSEPDLEPMKSSLQIPGGQGLAGRLLQCQKVFKCGPCLCPPAPTWASRGTEPLLSLRPHTVGSSPHCGSLSACCRLSLPDVLHPPFSLCCPPPPPWLSVGLK